jgi:hypothetical protein
MAQKGHGFSNIDKFGMGGMEAGTDGINSGMNGVDPINCAARHVAGLAG